MLHVRRRRSLEILMYRPEWGDSWMDYKNFKLIIAEIEQEKKEKMEQLQKEDENATIDISGNDEIGVY